MQTGSRNCTQSGSTNNLATETNTDAISTAMVGETFSLVYVYANLTQRFLDPAVPRWRTE